MAFEREIYVRIKMHRQALNAAHTAGEGKLRVTTRCFTTKRLIVDLHNEFQ